MPSTTPGTTPLDHEKYISLETFKKDGDGVKTPVWTAPLDGKLCVFSESKAYKVKRIRRDPRFRATGCDVRGKVKDGATWYQGTARIVEDPAEIERMLAALGRKYGFLMSMGNFFAKLSGRYEKRAYLELTVTGPV